MNLTTESVYRSDQVQLEWWKVSTTLEQHFSLHRTSRMHSKRNCTSWTSDWLNRVVVTRPFIQLAYGFHFGTFLVLNKVELMRFAVLRLVCSLVGRTDGIGIGMTNGFLHPQFYAVNRYYTTERKEKRVGGQGDLNRQTKSFPFQFQS